MIRIRTVREFLWQIAEQYGIADAYAWDDGNGIQTKTYFELNDDITKLAREMHRIFGEQRKIALIGDTSYSWICSFFATIVSANIVVPMDMKSQKEDMLKRINYADVSVVFLSDKYSDMKDLLMNSCRKVDRVYSLEKFIDDIPQAAEKEVLSVVYPDLVSAILFTSGTTGDGLKAAMLSQDGMLSGVKGYIPIYRPGDRVLSLLPIHHCFELFEGQMKALYMGCTICINDNITNIITNFKKFQITALVAVPAVANLICSIIEREIKTKSKEEVLDLLGGHLKRITIGGAPTNAKMIETMEQIGITVYDGYGLTESSGGVICNRNPKAKPESCGTTFAYDLDMRISESGELLLRGPSIMLGYYKQPELTNKIIENGWFHTGDMATITDDEFVIIAGRKDNMINLSNGEKVYPEEWEDLIEKIEGVTAVMVCATSDHLTAVIYAKDASEHQKKEIIEMIDHQNKDMPGYKKIPDIRFREKPFPVTSSMKIKRSAAIKELEETPGSSYVPPQNNEQAGILAQVKNILPNAGKISMKDNLYDLGLDSLTTLELAMALKCSPTLIYECKTIETLSEKIHIDASVDMRSVNKQLKLPNINQWIRVKAQTPKTEPKVIMITGASGYLGPHIIKELQKDPNLTIYALIRSKERFDAACEYYGVEQEKIKTVLGDVTKKRFGLSEHDYIKLCRKVDAVYHVAATVNHVGDVSDSYKINVEGTEEVICFCKASDAILYHMSSFAVSGFHTKKTLTENVLDIGQQITQNPYIQTKYQAEEKVLMAREDGVRTTIFRIGNLTARDSDGLFQMNAESSGLSAQIRALNTIGAYPKAMANMKYDHTQVDLAAQAIVLLAKTQEDDQIWHILNPNVQRIDEITNAKQVSNKEFDKLLASYADDKDANLLSLYYQMAKDGFNTEFSPKKTVEVLAENKFIWK